MAEAALQVYTTGARGYTHTRISAAVYLRQMPDTAALLPPPLAADARVRALASLLGRLDDLDLTPLLVYRTDSMPSAGLYALAWQLGVTGLAGWDLAGTDAARRTLLRRSIELHRHKGTPWAIRQALAAVGFPSIAIQEHIGRPRRNRAYTRNGQITRSPGAVWADFGITVGPATDGRRITQAVRTLLRGVAEVWKPARSRLANVRYAEYKRNGKYLRDGTAIRSGVAIVDRSLPLGYTAGAGGYTHARASLASFLEQLPDLITAYASGDSGYTTTRASTATYTASV